MELENALGKTEEANNIFTEYRVLTDSKCLASSFEVTRCLETERRCGAQLVGQHKIFFLNFSSEINGKPSFFTHS